ncbi:LysR family transcriptional regulator [Halomonas organivorans]|uniref:LysR family transcriptional regulator for metE and metH n=1 Tax=Halomonas organivorans TaxID=257772 RepID=A0A7W5G426_9GAMM|nr:LysR family transcriptional regulator [Halomonas organivorans]MBB3139699.1 LysR family transcriptional regulator for metE and metH [Halomonas organivorans]
MNVLDRTHWMLLAALKESGSITLAASTLNITQSAASQRLREAERRLGVRLVIKQGRALVLTEAGETIATAARAAAPMLQSAESDAIWQGKRSVNRVRVAWSHFDSSGLASMLLRLGRRMEPRVDLEFVRVSGERPAASLGSDVADLMLLPGAIEVPNLDSRRLFRDRLVAVVAANSLLCSRQALSPEDFQGERFLTYGLRPEPGWEYDLFFERGRRFPTEVSRIESIELICCLVASGEGISILPSFCVSRSAWAPGLRSIELDGPPIVFEWIAGFTRGEEATPSLAARLVEAIMSDLGVDSPVGRRQDNSE